MAYFEIAVNTSLYAPAVPSLAPTVSKYAIPHSPFALSYPLCFNTQYGKSLLFL